MTWIVRDERNESAACYWFEGSEPTFFKEKRENDAPGRAERAGVWRRAEYAVGKIVLPPLMGPKFLKKNSDIPPVF